jgi:trehalose 6-phosphate synthase
VDLSGHRFRAFNRTVSRRIPIGIDVDEFTALSQAPPAQAMFERMTEEYSRRQLLLGWSARFHIRRSKERIRAFALPQQQPENTIKSHADPERRPAAKTWAPTQTC